MNSTCQALVLYNFSFIHHCKRLLLPEGNLYIMTCSIDKKILFHLLFLMVATVIGIPVEEYLVIRKPGNRSKAFKSTIMKRFLLALFIFSCCFSFGQTTAPDTFTVAKADKKLAPFERKYIQYTETKEGLIRFNSILTRKLERHMLSGRERWLSVQTYQLEKHKNTDSSFCEPVTLMPIGYFTDIQSEGHKEKVVFDVNGITNMVIHKDSTKVIMKENNMRYNGVISDDIIACMPLKLNAFFVFKAVNPGIRYFEYTVTVIVEAREEIEIPGLGKIACWRVRTNTGQKVDAIQWYTVKGNVQVKKKFELANGSIFYRVLLVGG
jgi:hypothetical protein